MKIIVFLFVLGSISISFSFAGNVFNCEITEPGDIGSMGYPRTRSIYLRINDDGSLCKLFISSSDFCDQDVREKNISLKKETALLFDASLGIELLNVPRNFRRLNKFKGQEKLVPSSVDPTNLRLVKGKDGVNEMMCKVMKDLES